MDGLKPQLASVSTQVGSIVNTHLDSVITRVWCDAKAIANAVHCIFLYIITLGS